MFDLVSLVMLAMTTTDSPLSSKIHVTGLYRYAVKGLSADALDQVHLGTAGETFPDDRRYALLYENKQDKFNGRDWLHKENFLCAFTDPALMASLESKYQIVARSCQKDNANGETVTERILQINDRTSQELLLPPTDLATESGRQQLGKLLSNLSGKRVVCVTVVSESDEKSPRHKFQFGNTSSGYKLNKGDTRTIHIINQNTVNAVSDAIGIPLDPRRFRPNLVLDGPPPFAEFDWVQNGESLLTKDRKGSFRVLSKTVRCRGISLDPADPLNGQEELDLPTLLTKHFPQHGPYLGVYACLDKAPFSVQVGDELMISSVLSKEGRAS